MAIYNNFEIRVFAEGRPLPEYEHEGHKEVHDDDEGKGEGEGEQQRAAIRRYLESKPGLNFEIEIKAKQGFTLKDCEVFGFEISIDGTKLPEWCCIRKDDWNQAACGFVMTTRGVTKGASMRRFRFQALEQQDIDCSNRPDSVEHLGTILVEGWRLKELPTETEDSAETKKEKKKKLKLRSAPFRLSEEALKGHATDTVTRFDEEIRISAAETFGIRTLGDRPAVIFRFDYLSKEGLVKAGVLKQPVVPDPFEALRGKSLTDDEIDGLYEIANDARKNARKIKREREEAGQVSMTAKRIRTQYDPDELEEIQPPTALRKPVIAETFNID